MILPNVAKYKYLKAVQQNTKKQQEEDTYLPFLALLQCSS